MAFLPSVKIKSLLQDLWQEGPQTGGKGIDEEQPPCLCQKRSSTHGIHPLLPSWLFPGQHWNANPACFLVCCYSAPWWFLEVSFPGKTFSGDPLLSIALCPHPCHGQESWDLTVLFWALGNQYSWNLPCDGLFNIFQSSLFNVGISLWL